MRQSATLKADDAFEALGDTKQQNEAKLKLLMAFDAAADLLREHANVADSGEAEKHLAIEAFDTLRIGLSKFSKAPEFVNWHTQAADWVQGDPAPVAPASLRSKGMYFAVLGCRGAIAQSASSLPPIARGIVALLNDMDTPEAFAMQGATLIVPLMTRCSAIIKALSVR